VVDGLTVGFGLARNAAANTRDRLPPSFRDLFAAVLTGKEALACAQSTPGAGDSIVDARVDLFLYGSIVSPTNRHVLLLRKGKSSCGVQSAVEG
jgi:hypothetical protein